MFSIFLLRQRCSRAIVRSSDSSICYYIADILGNVSSEMLIESPPTNYNILVLSCHGDLNTKFAKHIAGKAETLQKYS